MALHHFLVERAEASDENDRPEGDGRPIIDAPGIERIRADEAQVGDRIKPPDGGTFYPLTDAERERGEELGDPDKVKLAIGWGSVTLDPDAIVEREPSA